jgi:hypothetical protein
MLKHDKSERTKEKPKLKKLITTITKRARSQD